MAETVYATVIRKPIVGNPEVLLIEFPEGVAGWRKWVDTDHARESRVDVGGQFGKDDGFQGIYDTSSTANTVAYLFADRPQVVGWKLNEMQWTYLKQQAEVQQRPDVALGRPRSLVQSLNTWRMWTKKRDAWI